MLLLSQAIHNLTQVDSLFCQVNSPVVARNTLVPVRKLG